MWFVLACTRTGSYQLNIVTNIYLAHYLCVKINILCIHKCMRVAQKIQEDVLEIFKKINIHKLDESYFLYNCSVAQYMWSTSPHF